MNKKKFGIDFLVSFFGVLFITWEISLGSISVAFGISLIVAYIYGKFGFWSF